MTRALALAFILTCAWTVVAQSVVWAHGLAPISVRIEERANGRVQVRWTLSSQGSGLGVAADGTPLMLALPEDCESLAAPMGSLDARWQRSTSRFACARGLAGQVLTVPALRRSDQALVVRYQGPDGTEHTRTLAGSDDHFEVPVAGHAPASPWAATARYVRIGLEHIVGGWDHLAFVVCLAVTAGRLRALWWPVTAFTLAHSLTLALATLGWLRVPAAPVEACIALSVVWMAAEAVRTWQRQVPARGLATYTFAFGLLHGLGFAGALQDVGFRGAAFAWALLGFNVGVELGQLAVLVGLAGLSWLLSLSPRTARMGRPTQRSLVEIAGALGGYWCVERSLSIVGIG